MYAEGMKKQIKSIADFIKSVRDIRDISQAELSKLMNLSKAYVSHLEMDRYQYPMDSLKRLVPILTHNEKQELLSLMQDQVRKDLGL